MPISSISTRRSGCRQSISALVLLVTLAGVTRNRLGLALAFGVNTVGFDALGNQVFLDGGSALLGQLLVVGSATQAVGVADGEDDFEVQFTGLTGEFVELGLTFRTQNSLVEVEQGVSGDGDLFASRFRSGGSRSGSRGGLAGADVSRDQVLVALATGLVGGSSSRGPVAGAPAQIEAWTWLRRRVGR